MVRSLLDALCDFIYHNQNDTFLQDPHHRQISYKPEGIFLTSYKKKEIFGILSYGILEVENK
jgi:hypothetical protein